MRLTIGGVDVQVVDEGEAEEADFVVCADAHTKTPFIDNIAAKCAHCGKDVIHRPYVPKSPPKICLDCCLLRTEDSHSLPQKHRKPPRTFNRKGQLSD